MSSSEARFRSKRIALKRRLALLFKKAFDPYPAAPDGMRLSPSEQHFAEYETVQLKCSRSSLNSMDVTEWQNTARAKLSELTGYRQSTTPANILLESKEPIRDGYHRHGFFIRDEWGVDLPVQAIWKEQQVAADLPVIVCLQGTNSGFHMSWGEELMPPDPVKIARGGDYAIQAADQGYLAICMEQSCFGLRMERKLKKRSADPCIDTANHLLLLGRSLAGDRASDISSVVTWMSGGEHNLPADREDVSIMGQSSGGSTAMFSGALDTRLRLIMATGCVGYIRDSIAARNDASGQNVIPGILNWMEMDDIVALCAPRPFLTVSGTHDHIWPISGGEAVVESARRVYREHDAEDNILAVGAEGPHQFFPNETWRALNNMAGRRPA